MASPEKLDFRVFEISRCLGKACSVATTENGVWILILLSMIAQCSRFEHTTSTCCHGLGSLMDHACTYEGILK